MKVYVLAMKASITISAMLSTVIAVVECIYLHKKILSVLKTKCKKIHIAMC